MSGHGREVSWRNNSIALFFLLAMLVLGYRFFTVPGTPQSEQSQAEQTPVVVPPKPMTVQEKKQRFRRLLVPAVDSVYNRLQGQYQRAAKLLATDRGAQTIAALKQSYRADTDSELLAALKPHPRSVALAQAALESSWGTSRFFNEANNVFGVWSFNSGEPRIAASGRRGSKTIWLKKYASIEASVADYYRVLALGRAYQPFRTQRLLSDNPYELLTKLDRYSEKGAAYGRELSSVLSYNKFAKYDEVFYAFEPPGLVASKAAELAAEQAQIAAAARVALSSIYSAVSYVDLAALAQSKLVQPKVTQPVLAQATITPEAASMAAITQREDIDAGVLEPVIGARSGAPTAVGTTAPAMPPSAVRP